MAQDLSFLRELIKEVRESKSMLLEGPEVEVEEDVHIASKMIKSDLYKIVSNANFLHSLIGEDSELSDVATQKIAKASKLLMSVKEGLGHEFSAPGQMSTFDMNQTIPREDALRFVDSIARKVDCNKTSETLKNVVDDLRQNRFNDNEYEEEVHIDS